MYYQYEVYQMYMLLLLTKAISLKDEFGLILHMNLDIFFVDTSHISAEQGKAIRNHIHYMFDRLLLEGCNEEDWIVPVLRWLMSQPVTEV